MGCSDSNNKYNEEDLDETQLIPMSYASDTGELVKKVIENFLILEKYTEITIGDYLESSSSNLSENFYCFCSTCVFFCINKVKKFLPFRRPNEMHGKLHS